jgi:hypothetical protein
MTNFRTLALTTLASGLLALGSATAMAQTVNNGDNTTQGESGHGTGCSNAPSAANGGGVSGNVNCHGNTSNTMQNGSSDGTTGTDMNSGASGGVITTNPDNSTDGETGHGQGCSNGQTAGSGNGTMNGGTGTNCQNTTN